MPAQTYSLGKDAVLTGVGGAIRDVTATIEADQIDVTARGDATRKFKAGAGDMTVEIECLEDPPAAGDEVTIGGDVIAAGTFIVTSVARSEPIDDVMSYKVSCKPKAS
jgi:hypothetical protein